MCIITDQNSNFINVALKPIHSIGVQINQNITPNIFTGPKIDKIPDYWTNALSDSSPKPPFSIIFVRKK
jgi:hypothetical protein